MKIHVVFLRILTKLSKIKGGFSDHVNKKN